MNTHTHLAHETERLRELLFVFDRNEQETSKKEFIANTFDDLQTSNPGKDLEIESINIRQGRAGEELRFVTFVSDLDSAKHRTIGGLGLAPSNDRNARDRVAEAVQYADAQFAKHQGQKWGDVYAPALYSGSAMCGAFALWSISYFLRGDAYALALCMLAGAASAPIFCGMATWLLDKLARADERLASFRLFLEPRSSREN